MTGHGADAVIITPAVAIQTHPGWIVVQSGIEGTQRQPEGIPPYGQEIVPMAVLPKNMSSTPNMPEPVNGMIRSYDSSHRSFTRPYSAKTIFFYKEGDDKFQGVRVPVSKARYRTLDSLMDDLNHKIPLSFGVRRLFTPLGNEQVDSLEKLQHMGRYICSSTKWARGIDWNSIENIHHWRQLAAEREKNHRRVKSHDDSLTSTMRERSKFIRSKYSTPPESDAPVVSKQVFFFPNGMPGRSYRKFIRATQLPAFDDLLKDVGDFLNYPVHRLFTIDGRRVASVEEIVLGADRRFIACQKHERPYSIGKEVKFPRIGGATISPRKTKASADVNGDSGSFEKLPSMSIDKTTSKRPNGNRVVLTKSHKRKKKKLVVDQLILDDQSTEDLLKPDMTDPDLAATKIQAAMKGYKTRKKIKKESDAAAKIQAGFRGFTARKKIKKSKPGENNNEGGDTMDLATEDAEVVDRAAVKIQAGFRGYTTRKKLKDNSALTEGQKSAIPPVSEIPQQSEEEEVRLIESYMADVQSEPNTDESRRCKYTIAVLTGNRWAADTEADLYLILHGTLGNSEKLWLRQNPDAPKFQQHSIDAFEVESLYVGPMKYITVGHEKVGYGAGVFLDRVIISDAEVDAVNYVFVSNKWFDSGQVDGKIERDLVLLGYHTLTPVAEADTMETPMNIVPKGKWSMTVNNGNKELMGVSSLIKLIGYGSFGHSEVIVLNQENQLGEPGASATFEVDFGNTGEIFKIRFHLDDPEAFWFLESVDMTELETGEQLHIECGKWLSTNAPPDGSSLTFNQNFRELPVVRAALEPLPIYAYQITLLTNKLFGAKTLDSLQVQLVGEFGESGFVSAPVTKETSSDNWAINFRLEAVSLGRLTSVVVVCDLMETGAAYEQGFSALQSIYDRHSLGFTAASEWIAGKVTVRETRHAPYQFQFGNGKIIPSDKPGTIKKQLKLINMEGLSTRRSGAVKNPKDQYIVTITTGEQSEAGIDSIPSIVFYGETGRSKSLSLSSDQPITPGSIIQYPVELKSIGLLYKVRIKLDGKGQNVMWFIKKMKIRDQNTGDELRFHVDMWLETFTDLPEASLELPAVWPDIPPMPIIIYYVYVYTGKQSESTSDFLGFIQIIGTKGDTGRRFLHNGLPEKNFESEQMSKFEVEGVCLDDITKIVVGMKPSSAQSSWRLEKVEIEDHDSHKTYTFSVKKILSKTKGLKKTEIEVGSPMVKSLS